MNAIQYQNAIVQKMGIGCFEKTFHEAKLIAIIISSTLNFIYYIINSRIISL
jgi:hypothetical protein